MPFFLLYSCCVLCIFQYFFIHAAPDVHPVADSFFLIHDLECTEKRSLSEVLRSVEAIEQSGNEQLKISSLGGETARITERQFHSEAPLRRLNNSSTAHDEEQQLSSMFWRERRDQMIAKMESLVKTSRYRASKVNSLVSEVRHNRFLGFRESSTPPLATSPISKQFLEHLAIDIIDDTLLPNNGLFNIAKQFACVQVERDSYRYPLALPNDFSRYLQWYMAWGAGGIGAGETAYSMSPF